MKNLQSLGSLSNLGNPSSNSSPYLLYDTFSDIVAAGSLNSTMANPIGGKRTVTDTNSKISTTGGVLNFATGETGNDAVWYPSLQRNNGRLVLGSLAVTTVGSPVILFGFDTNQSGGTTDVFRFLSGGTIGIIANGTSTVNVDIYTAVTYSLCVVMRSNGTFYFIKGGTFTNWTLLWHYNVGSGTLFPVVQAGNNVAIFTADNVRVPRSLWLPKPLAYDTFTRTNGVLGNTETSGPDSQLTPSLAWTSIAGTWAVSTNTAVASALASSLAFATVDTGKADIIIDANLTRSAGVVGVVLRYADSSNYIIAYHDGTNVKLDKVIGGTTTNVKSAVATYSAGATLRVSASGTSFRLFYNNAAVSTVGTISDAAVQTTTVHGLYTTDTGATFDNFLIFPKGTSTEYSALNNF